MHLVHHIHQPLLPATRPGVSCLSVGCALTASGMRHVNKAVETMRLARIIWRVVRTGSEVTAPWPSSRNGWHASVA